MAARSRNYQPASQLPGQRRRNARNPRKVSQLAKWAGAIAKCHDGAGASRANARQTDQICRSRPVQVDRVRKARALSFGRNAPKSEVAPEPVEEGWAQPPHPPKARDIAERPMALAIRHDPVRQGGPDPREAGQLDSTGTVHVDAFAGTEGPPLLPNGIAVGERVTVGRGVEERGCGRWCAGCRSDRAQQVAADEEREEQGQGATLAPGDVTKDVGHAGG